MAFSYDFRHLRSAECLLGTISWHSHSAHCSLVKISWTPPSFLIFRNFQDYLDFIFSGSWLDLLCPSLVLSGPPLNESKTDFTRLWGFGSIWSFSSWRKRLETKINSPSDRARRAVLGTSMEHLEHVPRRIHGGITSEKKRFRGVFGVLLVV